MFYIEVVDKSPVSRGRSRGAASRSTRPCLDLDRRASTQLRSPVHSLRLPTCSTTKTLHTALLQSTLPIRQRRARARNPRLFPPSSPPNGDNNEKKKTKKKRMSRPHSTQAMTTTTTTIMMRQCPCIAYLQAGGRRCSTA